MTISVAYLQQANLQSVYPACIVFAAGAPCVTRIASPRSATAAAHSGGGRDTGHGLAGGGFFGRAVAGIGPRKLRLGRDACLVDCGHLAGPDPVAVGAPGTKWNTSLQQLLYHGNMVSHAEMQCHPPMRWCHLTGSVQQERQRHTRCDQRQVRGKWAIRWGSCRRNQRNLLQVCLARVWLTCLQVRLPTAALEMSDPRPAEAVAADLDALNVRCLCRSNP